MILLIPDMSRAHHSANLDALPSAANGESYAILKGSRFHNGTIEVEWRTC